MSSMAIRRAGLASCMERALKMFANDRVKYQITKHFDISTRRESRYFRIII